MAQLLLHTVGRALEGDWAAYQPCQSRIAELQSSLGHDPSAANMLLATDALIEQLENYTRRAQFMEGKSEELQNIAIMLTRTMSRISAASQASVTRLRDLRGHLESARTLEDVRYLKAQLSQLLEFIRSKSERSARNQPALWPR